MFVSPKISGDPVLLLLLFGGRIVLEGFYLEAGVRDSGERRLVAL